MEETWKTIDGYNDRYEVSDLGRVRTRYYMKMKITKILQTKTIGDRYLKVTLVDGDGIRRTFYVHRLVAEAFLPQPEPEEKYVNHIDGDKQNNKLENLEFTTAKGNARNPATFKNYHRRYHHPGEWERRSRGQKRRFQREREQHIGRYANKNID